MSSSSKMTCEDVGKELKNFVSDMLPDQVYQDFIDHLNDCEKCTTHVRSLGSFSNQIWELADIEIPSDIDSTVLFKLEQTQKDTKNQPTTAPKSKKLMFAGIIIALGLAAFFGYQKFVKVPDINNSTVGSDAVIVQAPVIKKKQAPVDDAEAQKIFDELQKMADSLVPIQEKQVGKVIKKKETEEEKAEEVKEEAVAPAGRASAFEDKHVLHWHIPYVSDGNSEQIKSTIEKLNIDLDYEGEDFFVFETNSENINLISKGIEFSNRTSLNVPAIIRNVLYPDMKIYTSIFISGRYPTVTQEVSAASKLQEDTMVSFEADSSTSGDLAMDWHILLVSAKPDELLGAVQKGGGAVEYRSDEVVIFSVNGNRLAGVAEEVQGVGGAFADFGGVQFNEGSTWDGDVNVMIYFSDK